MCEGYCHCWGELEEVQLSDLSVKIDNPMPLFELPYYDPKTDSDSVLDFGELEWKWSVLFFYPADFTFVCPTELKDMADEEEKFKSLWVEVLAISTDTVFSHRAWVKHETLMKGFPYKMLEDHTWMVSEIFNILDDDWKAGRWTFIIDPDLVVRWIEVTSGPLWRNSAELIRKIEALQFMREHPTQACPAKWAIWQKTLTPSIKISGEVWEQLQ